MVDIDTGKNMAEQSAPKLNMNVLIHALGQDRLMIIQLEAEIMELKHQLSQVQKGNQNGDK